MTQCQAAVRGFGPQETKTTKRERERRNARLRVRAGQCLSSTSEMTASWLDAVIFGRIRFPSSRARS